MTINSTNDGEIDVDSLTIILSRRDALERVSKLYGEQQGQNALNRAMDSGDELLIEAIRKRAADFGWNLDESGVAPQASAARVLLVQLLNATLLAPDPIAAAKRLNDPSLSAAGLAEERTARITGIVDGLASQVSAIIAKLQKLSTIADTKADAVRPKLNPNDANQLTRTAQSWEFTIRPVLERDSVNNWSSLLDALDIDGLLAIQRFVPGWVKTQPITSALTSGLEQILEGAEARIPKVAGSPALAAAAANAETVRQCLEQAQVIAASVANVRSSADAIGLRGTVQRVSVYAGVADDIDWPGAVTY